MKRLTIDEAKEISIRKLTWIKANNGKWSEEIFKDIPKLQTMKNKCAFCELFRDKNCEGCPIHNGRFTNDKISGCSYEDHPYYIWRKDQTKENFERLFNLTIKNYGTNIRKS